jgi:hybrid cluster-associated redox disulfide protein
VLETGVEKFFKEILKSSFRVLGSRFQQRKEVCVVAAITPDMIIGDVLRMDPGTAPIFMGIGMHCLGCPSAQGESIKQACDAHGVDVNHLIKQLNEYFEKK